MSKSIKTLFIFVTILASNLVNCASPSDMPAGTSLTKLTFDVTTSGLNSGTLITDYRLQTHTRGNIASNLSDAQVSNGIIMGVASALAKSTREELKKIDPRLYVPFKHELNLLRAELDRVAPIEPLAGAGAATPATESKKTLSPKLEADMQAYLTKVRANKAARARK